MLVLRTSYFQRETIRPIVPRHKHSIVFIVTFTTKFASVRQFKNRFDLFSTILDESRESQM